MNPNEQLNELALFAGAGGGILGGKLLGWRTICAVEWEPYPACVLAARQNDGILAPFPIWDDVRTFNGKAWRGRVDVVSGGFPCQDISCAGKGAGIDGKRSRMWVEMARIIREVAPRYVFVENSPMLTSRGLGRVLGDLAEMGLNARWGVLGAKSTGGFHERERIWIYAVHSDRNGREAPQYQQSVLETQNGYKGHARHLARTVGLDGIRGMVDAYVQRNSNAVALAVDRFRAIGNGQVPSVAALAWRILSEA
jgi:DNA (cytosine-5)-methyltransferase 1